VKEKLVAQKVSINEFRIDDPIKERNIAIGYACFYFLFSILMGYLISEYPRTIFNSAYFIDSYLYAFIFKILFLLIVPLILLRHLGYTIKDLSPQWKRSTKSYVILSLSLLLGLLINGSDSTRISAIWSKRHSFSVEDYIFRIVFATVIIFFMAGLPEEVVYRGFLQTRIEKVHGRIPAIFLTALLFTAWHIPPRYFNASGIEGESGDLLSVIIGTGIPVFVLGLIIGLFWDRFRNLPALILFHWGVDIIPTIESYLGILR